LLRTVSGRSRRLAVASGCASFGGVKHLSFSLTMVGRVGNLSQFGGSRVRVGGGIVSLGSDLEVARVSLLELMVVQRIPLLMGH
jgi:hypothetical protein